MDFMGGWSCTPYYFAVLAPFSSTDKQIKALFPLQGNTKNTRCRQYAVLLLIEFACI